MTDTKENGRWLNCCQCKTLMWLPASLETAARANPNIYFHCAHGHHQHYPLGETEVDVIRRERDRLQQKLAEKDDDLRRQRENRDLAERDLRLEREKVRKMRARAKAGVCPCCNRSFIELRRHMATKHPEFRADEVAENVVSIASARSKG